MDEVKVWVYGLIGGPVLMLLLWYFRRSQTQIDTRLGELERGIEGLRSMNALKVDRSDIPPIWQAIRAQDQDIKNLGVVFSRELREQIDGIRREQNEHQRQTNDRLDRILGLMSQERSRP